MGLSILNSYILRRTAVFIAIVVLAIGGLLLVMGVADEISRRGSDSYTPFDAFLYKLYGLPLEVYQFIGPMVLLGTLLSVAGMAKNSELVIIQLASTSAYGLVIRLILPGLMLLPIVYFTGEWLAPQLRLQAEAARAVKLDRSLPTLSGEWYRDNEWIINVDFVSPDRDITGLTIFELDTDNDLKTVTYASTASPIDQGWMLNQVKRIEFSDQSVQRSAFETLTWQPANFNADLLGILSQRDRELTLQQLWVQVRFSLDQALPDPRLELTFWSRLWFPVQYIAMLFLALVFSFGSFRQKTLGDAAFKGVALAIAVQLVSDTTGSLLMVMGLTPILAALMPSVLFLGVTVWLVKTRL
jgi:LPS export ABC transporter permease LptG